jgi:capsular polysaccharide biosynthesis protein
MTEPTPPGVDWYQSEASTRVEMVTELQRIRRRTRVRPIPVLVVAALITAGITRKFATKPVVVEAQVVLALAEGSLSNHVATIPVDQLRQYVTSVLLPDNKLIQLIEKRNLYRLRKNFGAEYAVEELRSAFTVQIWKNTFVNYTDEEDNTRRSARIGLDVSDSDPDRAFDIAHDLASIAIDSAAAERQRQSDKLSSQVAALRDAVNDKLDKIIDEISRKQAAIADANRKRKPELAGVLRIDLSALDAQRRTTEDQLVRIAASRDELASEITAAGLDMSLSIVEEYRPERPTRSNFVLVMIAAVVGTGALVGSALVLGAFDSRVHDSDDVTRLGLPVVGHVPGFPGDHVGSMSTRSAARARVPSFQRWRSHR